MIPTGSYVVTGRQKGGKTGLMVAIEKTDWSYHGAERKALAEDHIKELNAIEQENPYNLHCPAHLYWSKSTVVLCSKPFLKTHRCDISEMAMPNSKFKTQYFPRYSFIIQPEFDKLLSSRNYKDNSELKEEIFDMVKFEGHQFMTIMMDGQTLNRGDIIIREHATDVFFIFSQKKLYEDEPLEAYKKRIDRAKQMYRLGYVRTYKAPVRRRKCIGAEWIFDWTQNQIKNHINEIKADGIDVQYTDYYKLCKFTFIGDDVRKCYNAFEGENYFLEGIEDYFVEPHLENRLDRETVALFNKKVPRKYPKINSSTENEQE